LYEQTYDDLYRAPQGQNCTAQAPTATPADDLNNAMGLLRELASRNRPSISNGDAGGGAASAVRENGAGAPCCDDVICFRVPSALRKAVNLAAERDYRSGSSYLRLALIERLHADGIALDTDEVSS
jgi:hypothetical protein